MIYLAISDDHACSDLMEHLWLAVMGYLVVDQEWIRDDRQRLSRDQKDTGCGDVHRQQRQSAAIDLGVARLSQGQHPFRRCWRSGPESHALHLEESQTYHRHRQQSPPFHRASPRPAPTGGLRRDRAVPDHGSLARSPAALRNRENPLAQARESQPFPSSPAPWLPRHRSSHAEDELATLALLRHSESHPGLFLQATNGQRRPDATATSMAEAKASLDRMALEKDYVPQKLPTGSCRVVSEPAPGCALKQSNCVWLACRPDAKQLERHHVANESRPPFDKSAHRGCLLFHRFLATESAHNRHKPDPEQPRPNQVFAFAVWLPKHDCVDTRQVDNT